MDEILIPPRTEVQSSLEHLQWRLPDRLADSRSVSLPASLHCDRRELFRRADQHELADPLAGRLATFFLNLNKMVTFSRICVVNLIPYLRDCNL